jgi:hypothetical protein
MIEITRRTACLGVVLWVFLCGALPFLPSCESREKVAGTYTAEAGGSPTEKEIILELRDNGEGIWRRGNDEVPFSWYLESGELRLNAKGGGVLVGKREEGTLRIALPGGKTLSFKKLD